MSETSPAPALPRATEAVLRFIESVGRRSEAELYLGLFRRLPKESFAIIAPGAKVIRQGQGSFTEQLRFLSDLGLAAPIVLGLFDPAQADGARDRLLKRLETAQLDFAVHVPGEADPSEALRVELCAGRWPIIQLTEAATPTTESRLAWLARLAERLDTRKLVLLRRRGPLQITSERSLTIAERNLLSVEAGALSLINLRTDTPLLTGQRLLRKEDATLFDSVKGLLESCADEKLLVSITSPLDLLRELFTTKGAGTLVKRGTAIRRFESYAELDIPRLQGCIEASFGHPLREAFFLVPPAAVYVEENYRGAAIVHDTPVGPYLAKFAVDPVAQGEGMGRDLWQAMARDFPALFWRTRADNSISAWYAAVCDGLQRLPGWHVFWRGLSPERVPQLVEHAAGLSDDFER
ncbi:MAG: hypothetical protein HYZ29_31905 [Myxococcales bacterium]|nr:hypothetical protein [Myxococcales bacterium]